MHSIWMPWFHLCWQGPCTQLYPSCWKAQQSSQARLLKRVVLKAFLLTCQCLHFLQQKPIHHVQKLDTLSVWHRNDPQFHIQRRLCTFPRIGRSVYIKHSCEMLWSLISVLTALLSAITGMGMQKVNADAFLGLIRGAWSGPRSSWREQCCLHGAVSPFFPNLLRDDNIGEQMRLCYCNSRLTTAGLAPSDSFCG